MSKTILKELRDAAASCTRPEYRSRLLTIADGIFLTLEELRRDPVQENMRDLNALWAIGASLLKNLPAEADPNPPMAGSPEPAKLAA